MVSKHSLSNCVLYHQTKYEKCTFIDLSTVDFYPVQLIYSYTLSCFSIHRKLRFINTEEFHDKVESMDLTTFQKMCMAHIDAAKEKLLKK